MNIYACLAKKINWRLRCQICNNVCWTLDDR